MTRAFLFRFFLFIFCGFLFSSSAHTFAREVKGHVILRHLPSRDLGSLSPPICFILPLPLPPPPYSPLFHISFFIYLFNLDIFLPPFFLLHLSPFVGGEGGFFHVFKFNPANPFLFFFFIFLEIIYLLSFFLFFFFFNFLFQIFLCVCVCLIHLFFRLSPGPRDSARHLWTGQRVKHRKSAFWLIQLERETKKNDVINNLT